MKQESIERPSMTGFRLLNVHIQPLSKAFIEANQGFFPHRWCARDLDDVHSALKKQICTRCVFTAVKVLFGVEVHVKVSSQKCRSRNRRMNKLTLFLPAQNQRGHFLSFF